MPGYHHVLLEKDVKTRIARLTLNRPEKRNALNGQTMDELGDALEDVEADDSIRVLILTGAGRSFCAGGDLEALPGGSEPGAWASENVDDIRIGSPYARFMVAYVRIGLFPGFEGTWLYPRMLGSIGKAAELLFTNDFLESDEAHRLGFLNKLVPQEDLEKVTMEMARKIASGPPVAMRLSKLMLYKGLDFDLDTAMRKAAAAETITLTSKDHLEGTAAIRESQQPVYRGE